MKLIKSISFLSLIVFAVSGCDQSKQNQYNERPVVKEKPKAESTKVVPDRVIAGSDSATTATLANYYAANLEEAKTEWHRCFEKGAANITEEERPRCVAAQNAWEMQPYKPKQRGDKK